jgi:hypothetical protein
MKFFNEKQLISTVVTLSLFNSASAGIFEDALNSISNSINGQNSGGSNAPDNKVFLADAPPDDPISGDDFSALFGKGGLDSLGLPQEAIDRAAAAAQGGDGADPNAYYVSSSTSPYVSATTTVPAGQTSFTSAIPTSSADQSSVIATTTSSVVQTSGTIPTPTSVKPYTSSTAAPSSTTSGTYPGATGSPAPGPSKGIIGVVFDLIKSVVGFLWSYRTSLWNFAYNYVIKPIFDWIGKKFSSGGSAYSTQG